MAYGILKCDNITFDNGGSDQNVTVSGLYRATTSGVTVSGTVAAGTISGVTVIGSTTVSGATVTGTTANFTSGNFSNIISSAATMSGALIMANQQQVRFREAVGNGVNHIALQAPAIVSADQTITLPDQTGTVVTTGDNGSVTSTMILDGTILNADISASAGIADTKLATISTAGKVSGTAITSGTINTSGELQITNNTPTIRLTESDGTATHSQTVLVRDSDQFLIQTRSSTGVFLSNDYIIPANASGATDHIWRIASTEKARLDSTGLTVVNDLTISDKIIHAGDTNTAIRFPAADTIALETNGSERARIDSSGRLLVGTSTSFQSVDQIPQIFLASTSSVAGTIGVGQFASTNFGAFYDLIRSDSGTIGQASGGAIPNNGTIGGIRFNGSDGAAFRTGATIYAQAEQLWASGDCPTRLVFSTTADGSAAPTERARIDSSGRLLVGTSTSQGGNASFQVGGNSSSGAATTSAINAFGFDARLRLTRATTGSPITTVANGNLIGQIAFDGYDGADYIEAARIFTAVDGTPGANDMPGRLVFSTTADGSASPTEAMRINNARELLIGYTADNGAYKLQVNSQIFATSATVATSDGRYKENVATLNGCIDLVSALRPVSFDWKPQQDITRIDEDGNSVLVREGHNFPNGKQVGFIAQEVQAVLADKPWLGSVIKQNVRPAIEDADGNELAPEEEFFGIAEGNLTAVLTAALQEAIAMISALEARVAALES